MSMTTVKLADLQNVAYLKRKPEAKKIFIRDDYCRAMRKYLCMPEDDVWGAGMPLKGTTIVYVD